MKRDEEEKWRCEEGGDGGDGWWQKRRREERGKRVGKEQSEEG